MKKVMLMLVMATMISGCWMKEDHDKITRLRRYQADMNQVLLDATAEGLAEAKRRGAKDLPELPGAPKTPDGQFHPVVKTYAMDGDGRLRGQSNRDSMSSLKAHAKQTQRWIDELPICLDWFCP